MRIPPHMLREALTSAIAEHLSGQINMRAGAQITDLDDLARPSARFGDRAADITGLDELDMGYIDAPGKGDAATVFFGSSGQAGMVIPSAPVGTRGSLPS